MKQRIGQRMEQMVWNVRMTMRKVCLQKEAGMDGILVTVGLCIIALLLCVVMKDSMSNFITTLVTAMTTQAQRILTGAA